jgi:hypothetical protein
VACNLNSECCSGFCSSSKGRRCGCASNADCPKAAPVCTTGNGICHS